MNVAIRVDASSSIGLGHLMRCLTLADELKNRGAQVYFVCRASQLNIDEFVVRRGHMLRMLPGLDELQPRSISSSEYENWLGVAYAQDAQDTIDSIANLQIKWFVVDHYGIDFRWHAMLRPHTQNVMVIDDLLDRRLDCDLLLNQTLGIESVQYSRLTKQGCLYRLGPKYALLRPEFHALRKKALTKRRGYQEIRRVLVFLGGMDPGNITGKVLDALGNVKASKRIKIDVVLGSGAPHLEEIEEKSRCHPMEVDVKVGVKNMAALMLESDLAIGAGGTATWERCALALPTLLTVLAENQSENARIMQHRGAVSIWKESEELVSMFEELVSDNTKWKSMFQCAESICDGLGVSRIVDDMSHDLEM